MTCVPGPAQQLTCPATNIEHGFRRHHERQVEAEVAPSFPWMKHVVQLGETGLDELMINHHGSVADKMGRQCAQVRRQPVRNMS